MRKHPGPPRCLTEGPCKQAPCQSKTCPLSQAPGCRRLRVCRVGGDRRFSARMATLGVLPGRELELLRDGEDCLVRMDDSTITLDRSLSEQILVSTE